MTPFDLADKIGEVLAPLGVPINPTGYPERCIIVTVDPGTVAVTRADGLRVNRVHHVQVMCIAPTSEACTWLAYHATDLLDGFTTGSPHGRVRDVSYDGPPTPDTSTQEREWVKALDFEWTIKRGIHDK